MAENSIGTQPIPDRKEDRGITSSFGLWAGIIFCVVYTLVIWALEPFVPKVNFAPDTGFAHYLWKLPDPNFLTRLSAWTGYTLHQALIWGCIYYGQSRKLKYTGGLHPVNIVALGGNAVFVFLHLLQTHIWYDGLAQDVHIMTAQGSVIILLVAVLMMENQRRGLFFGKKLGLIYEPGRALRKYHGYFFSWAVIWTFWYHPMETTSGHLMGTLYTCLLMLQGSLFFTRAHVNKWWTISLETIVLVHGTMVAVMATSSGDMWPQFFFGFFGVFIVTQMHGLGLRKWLRWTFIAAYLVSVFIVFSTRDLVELNQLVAVPAVEYSLVFVLALFIWCVLWVVGRITGRATQES